MLLMSLNLVHRKVLAYIRLSSIFIIGLFFSASALALSCTNPATGASFPQRTQAQLNPIVKSVNQKAIDISWVDASEQLKRCSFNGSSRVSLTFANEDSVTYEIRNETLILITKDAWSSQPVSGTCYSIKTGSQFPSNGMACN